MRTAAEQTRFEKHEVSLAGDQRAAGIIPWVLIALYAAARVLQIHPGGIPMLAVVALHVLPAAAFALAHGARFYGWRGVVAFVTITLLVGNVFENVGVSTGFPFGHYYFTVLMGPKLFAVPVLLGLAYVGMAYVSWTLGRLILGDLKSPLVGWHAFTLPLVASCIMVSWDLSQDPVWSTVLRAWVFPRGGAYFGVPLSNFAGWYLTVYVLYQLFALYLSRRPPDSRPLPPYHWHQAVLFYAVSAAGNILLVIPQAGLTVVSDPAGVPWRVNDITATCALVTIFTMGTFALLAWVRLKDQNARSALL